MKSYQQADYQGTSRRAAEIIAGGVDKAGAPKKAAATGVSVCA